MERPRARGRLGRQLPQLRPCRRRARAIAAAIERGAAGTSYLAVDDEPVTQRALVDTVSDAAGRRRPGSSSIGVAGARVGFPLARSLSASLRVRNARAKAELGWAPRFPTVREGVWPVAAALTTAARQPRIS